MLFLCSPSAVKIWETTSVVQQMIASLSAKFRLLRKKMQVLICTSHAATKLTLLSFPFVAAAQQKTTA